MNSGWDSSKASWKDVHPIGHHAEQFLLENADWAVYVRLLPDEYCPDHWNFTSGVTAARSDGPLCPYCWGTGRKVIPKIVPVRIFQGSVDTQSDIRLQPGYTLNWEIGAILPRDIKPNYQDLVILVEWNVPVKDVPKNPSRRPVRITDVTQVEAVFDRFEREVAFIGAALKSYSVSDALFYNALPLMIGLDIYDPSNKWPQTLYW